MAVITAYEMAGMVEVPENFDWAPVIADAEVIVDSLLTGKGVSAPITKLIVKNMTAHLAVLSVERGGFTAQKKGESEDKYVTPNSANQGLRSTRFGQMAIQLDPTGSLASMGNTRLPALFRVYT